MISINYLIVSFSNYILSTNPKFGLTQPQKLANRVKVALHLHSLSWHYPLANVGLGFFSIHPLTPSTFGFGAWIIW